MHEHSTQSMRLQLVYGSNRVSNTNKHLFSSSFQRCRLWLNFTLQILLFCRQPERQLRLFDFREKPREVHAFGWKQESSESQSALIDQSWSPDGMLISSGSVDPVIHIFDVRYNARKPSQSIRAHDKRVFKAVWHQNLPLLISISSDLNIGMHKIT